MKSLIFDSVIAEMRRLAGHQQPNFVAPVVRRWESRDGFRLLTALLFLMLVFCLLANAAASFS